MPFLDQYDRLQAPTLVPIHRNSVPPPLSSETPSPLLEGPFPLLLYPAHLEQYLIPCVIPFSYLFLGGGGGLTFGILVPQPRIRPQPPAVEAWSPYRWTTREVPNKYLFFLNCISLSYSKKDLQCGAGSLEYLGLGDGGRNDPKRGGSFPLGR